MSEHVLQAQRLREIDDLLAECQRHSMPRVMVSYAQLRAMRSAAADYQSGWSVGYKQGRHDAEAMRQTLPAPHEAKMKAQALREAADDLFGFGDEEFVAAAKWLQDRAEELERE